MSMGITFPQNRYKPKDPGAHVKAFTIGTDHLGLTPERSYAGGERGWIGDSPFIFLKCDRMRSLGWQPGHSIRDGILKTLKWLEKNQWVLEARE